MLWRTEGKSRFNVSANRTKSKNNMEPDFGDRDDHVPSVGDADKTFLQNHRRLLLWGACSDRIQPGRPFPDSRWTASTVLNCTTSKASGTTASCGSIR